MEKEYIQPETGLGSTAETNRLLGREVFDPKTGGAINSEALKGNEKAYSIPDLPPSTLAEGITGMTPSYVERGKLQKEQQQKALEAEANLSQEKGKLEGFMEKYLGIQSSRSGLEEKAGIQKLTDTADEYRISLEESQRAQMNEIKALEGIGLTDVQKAQSARAINRKYAIEQADLQFATDIAERRLDRASKAIDRKIELQLEPLKTQMEFTKFFYEENRDLFNKAEERAFQTKIKQLDQQYETEKTFQTLKGKTALEAASAGADQATIRAINQARNEAELASAAGTYAGGLEAMKTRLEIQKLRKEINPQNTVTTGTIDDLTNILGSSKIGQSTKTSIGTILGVINAIEDMANANQDGEFTGFNPLAGFTTGVFNTFLPGKPGKPSFLKRDETISNETYLEGINLKIQQWASGAALTEAQTAQVKRMTPVKGDTDRVIKRKLNELTNFMNQQIKGSLMAEGIDYDPVPVDLFKEQTLDAIFSDVSTTTPTKK